jgi:hypothetical protein
MNQLQNVITVTSWQHGSQTPRYVLKCLYIEKSQIAHNSATTEAREKLAQIWNP